jgi:hypothetical protein
MISLENDLAGLAGIIGKTDSKTTYFPNGEITAWSERKLTEEEFVEGLYQRVVTKPPVIIFNNYQLLDVEMSYTYLKRLSQNQGLMTDRLTVCSGLALDLVNPQGEHFYSLSHFGPETPIKSTRSLLDHIKALDLRVNAAVISSSDRLAELIEDEVGEDKVTLHDQASDQIRVMALTNQGGYVFHLDHYKEPTCYFLKDSWSWTK